MAESGATSSLNFGGVPVRPEMVGALEQGCLWLACSGDWWSAGERAALVQATRRAVKLAPDTTASLPVPAQEAVRRLALGPLGVDEAFVQETAQDLGQQRYVELVLVVAVLAALDTFCRLLGRDLLSLPPPERGEASSPLKSRNAARLPVRTHRDLSTALMEVPAAVSAMNQVTAAFYLTGRLLGDPAMSRRGLTRAQMELVAASVSWANKCFY